MDQFEAARLKNQKRLDRLTRYEVKLPEPEPINESVGTIVTEEKPSLDGFVDVTVTLPKGSFSFRLTKKNVMANVPNARLNLNEVKKLVNDGLTPLMGRMD